jgi:hypothetical protein
MGTSRRGQSVQNWRKKGKREDFLGKAVFFEGKREGKRGLGRANVDGKGTSGAGTMKIVTEFVTCDRRGSAVVP